MVNCFYFMHVCCVADMFHLCVWWDGQDRSLCVKTIGSLAEHTHPSAAEMAGDCSRGDGTSGRALRVEEDVVTEPSVSVCVIREQQWQDFSHKVFVQSGAHDTSSRCSLHRCCHLCVTSPSLFFLTLSLHPHCVCVIHNVSLVIIFLFSIFIHDY